MTLITANTLKLANAFQNSGFKIRFVGGCVRDFVLGVKPKDIDFCTDATPDQMVAVANQYKIHTVETGLKHGTLTFVIGNDAFEVTTLRIDMNCDGRHADVHFTKSFKEDAARRDFTMNAMSMDFNGTIYDYFGGRDDIKSNVIRFVGEAEDRVREDFLRVLRYFRFAARFDMILDPIVTDMFKNEWVRDGLSNISSERIWAEVSKTLTYKNINVLKTIISCGLKNIVCFVDDPFIKWHKFDNIRDAIDGMYIVGKAPEIVGDAMKLSNAEMSKLNFLWNQPSDNVSEDTILYLLAEGYHREWIISWAAIHSNPSNVSFAENAEKPIFPVKGADLLDLGFVPGPGVGKVLHDLKNFWYKSRFTLDRNDLLKMI